MNSHELLPQESSTQLEVVFDYSVLDSEARSEVQDRTSEIKSLMRRATQDIIEIGLKLIQVKHCLGHGHFSDWLEAEFEWKERTARNFMRVAEVFKSANFADLSIAASALYLLAAPSTPEPARSEALERARAGDFITITKAKRIVSQHKKSTFPQPTKTESSPTVENLEVTTPEESPALRAEPFSLSEPQTIDVSAFSLEDEGLGDRDIRLESDSSSSEMELADLTQKKASSPDQIRLISIEREEPSPSLGDVAGTESVTIAVRLAIEGRPEALTILFEQMQKNPSFAESVIGQALFLAESEGVS